MLDTLDAAAVARWSSAALADLEASRAELDALNVFPVPDGDTGTNMLATLRSGHVTLDAAEATDASAALGALARGAALGAIGNSGFILSQFLRGLAGAPAGPEGWGRDALSAGLEAGARLGRQAVVTPIEGTILSVAQAAAAAAGAALRAGRSLAEMCSAAVRAADEAVQLTPTQLPDLAEAGVVDAGGRGLLVVLDALGRTVGGQRATLSALHVPVRAPRPAVSGYEVQYLVEAGPEHVAALHAALAQVGDSVAVVEAGDPGWVKVHVHAADIGAAVEAGFTVGRPRRVEVTPLTPPGRTTSSRGTPSAAVAVVAVAPGDGLAHLFAGAGDGIHVVEGLPSVDEVVAAIRDCGARDVVLLPNASRISGVAEAAAARARARGLRVTVVPTRSPVQGLAAVAVHDPARRFDDDVVAMAEAAAATRYAEVSIATGRGLTAVGICEPGDVLGMIDGEVVEVGRGLLAVVFGLLDRLLGVGAELITVLVGDDAPRRTGELIEAHVRGRAPLTDVTVYAGGHSDHPVIIGVE